MTDKTKAHVAFARYLKKLREILSFDFKPIQRLHNLNEGREIKCRNGKFHTDNGTEYKTENFKNLLAKEGIIYDPCNPRTPQHNAIPERLNLEIELIVSGQSRKRWNAKQFLGSGARIYDVRS